MDLRLHAAPNAFVPAISPSRSRSRPIASSGVRTSHTAALSAPDDIAPYSSLPDIEIVSIRAGGVNLPSFGAFDNATTVSTEPERANRGHGRAGHVAGRLWRVPCMALRSRASCSQNSSGQAGRRSAGVLARWKEE